MAGPAQKRPLNIRIGPPRHESGKQVELEAEAELKEGVAGTPPGRTAIIVWHGMGQQLSFETIELVAKGLLERLPESARVVNVELAELGPEKLWRAEFEAAEPDAQTRPVHVYEVYWAPLTQGKITLAQTIAFLISAGSHGIRYGLSSSPLPRFLFGQHVEFPLSPLLTGIYLALLLAVLALVTINAVVTTVATLKLITGPSSWLSAALLQDLTLDLALLSVVVIPLLLTYWLVDLTQKAKRKTAEASHRVRFVGPLIWLLIMMAVLAAILVGLLIIWHVLSHGGLAPPAPAVWRQWVMGLSGSIWWWGPFVWIVVYLASWRARWFLLEYAGDSAIYVWSHKLNQFHETREAIRDCSLRKVRAIYESGNYDRILLAGHSLGSVIAYDTLNRLIIEDKLAADKRAGQRLHVADRTKLLITFGSVLDKTAFLFRAQSDFGEVREGLAAATQPLIHDRTVRPPWINIYSRNDPFSGRLDYYHLPTDPSTTVRNLVDPDAWIPIAAHNQYWRNDALLNTLKNALWPAPPSS
jgi:hypothetical protein